MSANVQTTITVKGNDQFSAMFNKLKGEADKTGAALESVSARTSAAGEHAGKLERGFMGFKDIIGGVAEGPLAAIADRMGGIEAVVQGFGPGFGAAGLAIAGVAAGLTYLYQEAEKARTAEREATAEKLRGIAADKTALAERYSVTAELLGVQKQAAGLDGIKAKAQQLANDLIKVEQEIADKRVKDEDANVKILEKKVFFLRDALQMQQAFANAAKEESERRDLMTAQEMRWAEARGTDLEIERKAELLLDKRQRVTDLTNLAMRQREEISKRILELEQQTSASATFSLKGMWDLLAAKTELYNQDKKILGLASEGEALMNERRAKSAAAGQAARAKRKADEDARMAKEKDHEAWVRQNMASRRDELIARENEVTAVQDRIRAGEIAAAESPVAKARLALLDAEIKALRERELLEVQFAGDGELRELRSLEIDQRVAAERRKVAEEEKKASDDKTKKAQAESDSKIDGAMGVAFAVVAGLEQMGIAEQAAAGLKAALSAAEAGLAAARGNYAGAVAGAFAAVQFGKIALTGGGAPQVPGLGGGGGESTASQRGTQGGTAGAMNIFFTKGFYGDAASTAKGIAGTMKSLKNTGIPARKGV